jgi:hypothetical protein
MKRNEMKLQVNFLRKHKKEKEEEAINSVLINSNEIRL